MESAFIKPRTIIWILDPYDTYYFLIVDNKNMNLFLVQFCIL